MVVCFLKPIAIAQSPDGVDERIFNIQIKNRFRGNHCSGLNGVYIFTGLLDERLVLWVSICVSFEHIEIA